MELAWDDARLVWEHGRAFFCRTPKGNMKPQMPRSAPPAARSSCLPLSSPRCAPAATSAAKKRGMAGQRLAGAGCSSLSSPPSAGTQRNSSLSRHCSPAIRNGRRILAGRAIQIPFRRIRSGVMARRHLRLGRSTQCNWNNSWPRSRFIRTRWWHKSWPRRPTLVRLRMPITGCRRKATPPLTRSRLAPTFRAGTRA